MNKIEDLVLEVASDTPEDDGIVSPNILLTPTIDEDYWLYRVRLTEDQAVVGFPKFFTIGIGFAVEEDWNTNLPYKTEATEIAKHIHHNRGSSISESPEDFNTIVAAIQLIQKQAELDKGKRWKD